MNYNQEIVENLIIYKTLCQNSFALLIHEHLDVDLFDKSYNKTVILLLQKFYKEHKKFPKADEINLIITDENTKILFKEAINIYKKLDKNLSDDIFLPYVERFLKDKLRFKAISDSVNDYEKGSLSEDDVKKRFDKVSNLSLISNFGLDYFKDIKERVKRIKLSDDRISTGFPSLDKKLNGGILKYGKCLICFVGEPNVGKSVVLGNLAANFLKQNLRISIISLEMSSDSYANRIDSLLTNIKINEISSKTEELEEKLEEYSLQNNKSELYIKEYPPKGVTVSNILNYYIKLEEQNKKPDVIIIDYINLIRCDEKGLARDEKVNLIVEELRAITYIIRCPLITVTQSSRSAVGDGKSPGMEDTSDSMGVPRVSDFYCSIYQEEEDKLLGIMRWEILKSRLGEAFGKITLKLDYGTLKLTEEGDYFSETALDAENKLNQL